MPDPESSYENTVTNSGPGDQNIAQGDNAVGKQINDNRSSTQTIEGNANTVAGRDVRIEHHHHPPTSPESACILPTEDDIFLHREAELAWLDEHLSPDRVVAVCGPGGMGKSALAARAVRSLPPDRFPDGIIFHTFYHQAETTKALQTIAHALGLKAEADLEQQVAAALGSRQALLVLDGAEEAEDLQAVLPLRGRCGVLVTTRKKSDCGPFRWDLQALPDDEAEEVLRAWGGQAGDQEAIEQIAELLGGWPVALRLAGHYLHSTGEPATDYLRWLQEEPFKELGESEEHQRDNAALLLRRSTAQVGEDARLVLGLAGCLAFDLLSPAPMTALLEGDERRCRKAVNELVNYGLLERRGERLHIGHALIHEYAARNLALSRETLERVAAYYIDWCREQSAAGVPGYARMDDERGHCLRLIRACLDGELWQEVKDLVGAIQVYLDRQGWWTERLAALEMRLTAARQTGDRRDEAWCLNSLGYTCARRGDQEKALAWFEQCLPVYHEQGMRKEEGVLLNNMAYIYDDLGKYEQALEQYEQSLSIRREVGDREGEGTTLNNIGTLYWAQKKYDEALPYYEQCLPIHREVGDTIGEGTTLNNIASIYDAQGKPGKAVEYYKKALAIVTELGDRKLEAEDSWNIGLAYEDMGDFTKAEEYIALAVEIEEQIGHPDLENDRNHLKQLRAKRRGA
ncbi:MAG: tetratricopeptide repeat protein [Candidatus Electrothrix aestuarii]|uniref:Tetratricopeptide repeat protein n=1 Tax=Candidatus Electrothrix aestuarii TaxID=3062594 RepID=A0AAU8M0X2_9BACT|nr:tetratricopeptide repeat protein [Candidatus Electrothrix aestuarii]